MDFFRSLASQKTHPDRATVLDFKVPRAFAVLDEKGNPIASFYDSHEAYLFLCQTDGAWSKVDADNYARVFCAGKYATRTLVENIVRAERHAGSPGDIVTAGAGWIAG